MYIRSLSFSLLAALVLALPCLAQEEPPEESLSHLENAQALIQEVLDLQIRQDAVEGEDHVLYGDLIRRRSPLLRQALNAHVEELTAEGATPSEEELDQARDLILQHREWVLDWLGSADEEIRALRVELPEASPDRELEIENELTVENDLVDTLLATLVDYSDNLSALDADPLYEPLDKRLVQRAELTAARLQKSVEDIAVIERRLEQVGEGGSATDLETRLSALREKASGTTKTLEVVTTLLERRDVDTAEFRELLLESTGQITAKTLDAEIALSFAERSLEDARQKLIADGPTWLVRTLVFLLIVLLSWLLSRIVRSLLRRVLDHSSMDFSHLLENFLVVTVSRLVFFLGLLVALSQAGLEIAPFLAGLGVAGVVLGLALQDTLSNLFSGFMILMFRPYDVDDVVDAGGVSGKVREMSLVTTTILTPDNKRLVVPNNKIWGDTIQNVTAETLRRVDFEFGVGYDDDVDQVESVLKELLDEQDLILDDPEPTIRLHRLDDSAVVFIVRPWVKRDDYWTVYWEMMRSVKTRFDAEGISIPFPQRDIHVIEGQAVPDPSQEVSQVHGHLAHRSEAGEDTPVDAPT